MTTKEQKAYDLFKQGYNCAQAVFGAFCEDYGLPLQTGLMLSSGFGGGMGRMRSVCGTVTGMFMAASLALGYNSAAAAEEKTRTYAMIQDLAAQFKQQNGSIVCAQLLGIEEIPQNPQALPRTAEYYKKRPCADLAAAAAGILEQYLREHTKA